MALKLKIIMNPSSGREQAMVHIEDMLAHLVARGALERADISYTSKRYDAKRFAENTDASQYDYIVAVGGDGTVNEVLTGIMNAKIDLPLAIYTAGTVNDFATINGIPTTPASFARMLMSPDIRKVDCGKVGDRYFLNVLAGGLMTDVAYKVSSELKTAFGPAAYWLSAMKDIPGIHDRPAIPLVIKTEDETVKADALMFMISNSKSVGGFRKLMTMADLSDGLLDVLIVKKMDPSEVIPLLGELMMGDHIYNDNVVYFQTDKMKISVRGKSKVVLDLDGEKGPSLPCEVSCIRDAITLVVPNKEDSK
ncbi:MAG: diacylglycerol kinase family lipid kinase [Clostridiales bacterium]|nr:diacylglycerol kinase family lipid kinase [Clostridiales bacterium]